MIEGLVVEGKGMAVQDWLADCIDAVLLKVGVQRKGVDNVVSLSFWSVTQFGGGKVENQPRRNDHDPLPSFTVTPVN